MENFNQQQETVKQRHGCVTAWLVLIIVVNAVISLIYLTTADTLVEILSSDSFNMYDNTVDVSKLDIYILALLGIANVVFAIMLLNWKKSGFWGFLITSIIVFVLNLSIGINIIRALAGLLGVVILYAILQIKKDGVSAWENLE